MEQDAHFHASLMAMLTELQGSRPSTEAQVKRGAGRTQHTLRGLCNTVGKSKKAQRIKSVYLNSGILEHELPAKRKGSARKM